MHDRITELLYRAKYGGKYARATHDNIWKEFKVVLRMRERKKIKSWARKLEHVSLA